MKNTTVGLSEMIKPLVDFEFQLQTAIDAQLKELRIPVETSKIPSPLSLVYEWMVYAEAKTPQPSIASEQVGGIWVF